MTKAQHQPDRVNTQAETHGKPGAKAVIYCRVSDVKQVTQGSGLGSQETRCQEYARHKNYDVTHVFKDDASGGLIERPDMQAMLSFLRKHKPAKPIL